MNVTQQKRAFEFVVSSDPANGAVNITADGSRFELNLNDPLGVPENAQNVECSVPGATVWFNTYNIIGEGALQNNLFAFNIRTGPLVGDKEFYSLSITPGLYTYTQLTTKILDTMVAASPANEAAIRATFIFTKDDATQTVSLFVGAQNVFLPPDISGGNYLYLQSANSFSSVIGFEKVPPVAQQSDYVPWNTIEYVCGQTAGHTYTSTLPVSFNNTEYYLLHTDLVSRGIRFNDVYDQTVAQVLIKDTQPNAQIAYEPFNAPVSEANILRGARIVRCKFWITDSQNRAIDTRGEFWSMRLRFTYEQPVFVR
jgi:hypothetical protein